MLVSPTPAHTRMLGQTLPLWPTSVTDAAIFLDKVHYGGRAPLDYVLLETRVTDGLLLHWCRVVGSRPAHRPSLRQASGRPCLQRQSRHAHLHAWLGQQVPSRAALSWCLRTGKTRQPKPARLVRGCLCRTQVLLGVPATVRNRTHPAGASRPPRIASGLPCILQSPAGLALKTATRSAHGQYQGATAQSPATVPGARDGSRVPQQSELLSDPPFNACLEVPFRDRNAMAPNPSQ